MSKKPSLVGLGNTQFSGVILDFGKKNFSLSIRFQGHISRKGGGFWGKCYKYFLEINNEKKSRVFQNNPQGIQAEN